MNFWKRYRRAFEWLLMIPGALLWLMLILGLFGQLDDGKGDDKAESAGIVIGIIFLIGGIVWLVPRAVSQLSRSSQKQNDGSGTGRMIGSAWKPKEDWATDPEQPSRGPISVQMSATYAPSRERAPSLLESGDWPPPDYAIENGVLYFTYVDAEGEVTDRRLRNWSEDDEYDHCFRGFDLTRGDVRTFRIDRVDSWGR